MTSKKPAPKTKIDLIREDCHGRLMIDLDDDEVRREFIRMSTAIDKKESLESEIGSIKQKYKGLIEEAWNDAMRHRSNATSGTRLDEVPYVQIYDVGTRKTWSEYDGKSYGKRDMTMEEFGRYVQKELPGMPKKDPKKTGERKAAQDLKALQEKIANQKELVLEAEQRMLATDATKEQRDEAHGKYTELKSKLNTMQKELAAMRKSTKADKNPSPITKSATDEDRAAIAKVIRDEKNRHKKVDHCSTDADDDDLPM